jgi:hypothetical protein
MLSKLNNTKIKVYSLFGILLFIFFFSISFPAVVNAVSCKSDGDCPGEDEPCECSEWPYVCGWLAGACVKSGGNPYGTCQYTCHHTGPGCFPPGTIVKTLSGGTPIQSIRIGNTVTSFNDQTNKIENSSVSNIYKVHRTFYFSITVAGYHVDVTAEHPFYIGSGKYKEAQNLKTGDVLYVDQNNNLIPTVVAQNVRINEPTDAYNMTVDNTHTFFANNFAVHNKGSVHLRPRRF